MAGLALPIASAVAAGIGAIYSTWKTWSSGKLREAEKAKSEAEMKKLLEQLRKEHKEAEKGIMLNKVL